MLRRIGAFATPIITKNINFGSSFKRFLSSKNKIPIVFGVCTPVVAFASLADYKYRIHSNFDADIKNDIADKSKINTTLENVASDVKEQAIFYSYVLIGGGTPSYSAAEEILKSYKKGKILMTTEESK
jgi:hypothetical protein